MVTVGKMIHGDAEGFLCDILYQATSTEKRIDSILEMPRVVDRLVLAAISSSEMYYAWLYLVLMIILLVILSDIRLLLKIQAENKKASRDPQYRIRALAACLRAKIGRKVADTVRKNTSLRYNPQTGTALKNFFCFLLRSCIVHVAYMAHDNMI